MLTIEEVQASLNKYCKYVNDCSDIEILKGAKYYAVVGVSQAYYATYYNKRKMWQVWDMLRNEFTQAEDNSGFYEDAAFADKRWALVHCYELDKSEDM